MRLLVLLCLALALAVSADAHARRRPHLSRPKHGFQMRVGAYTIQPGQDLEMCEYRRLPIGKAVDVSRFTLSMPEGAHHFVMWGYGGSIQDDSRFPRGPVPSIGCTGIPPDDPFPQLLIPTQSPNTELRFPPGIALRLEPHQQVFLNPHMRNFGAAPMEPDIRFNFQRARKGTVCHYAQGLTFGNMTGIHIPAGGDQTITAEWTAPIDMTIIHLATHQHRLGTYANIEQPSTDGTWKKIVETFDWQHPGSVWRDIHLAKGEKLRLTCTWHNTDDHEVRFGPKTTDEMCFVIGFYYRNAGDTTPVVGGGCLPARKGMLCPLAPLVSP